MVYPTKEWPPPPDWAPPGGVRAVVIAAHNSFPMALNIDVAKTWCAVSVTIRAPWWWRAWWMTKRGHDSRLVRERDIRDLIPAHARCVVKVTA